MIVRADMPETAAGANVVVRVPVPRNAVSVSSDVSKPLAQVFFALSADSRRHISIRCLSGVMLIPGIFKVVRCAFVGYQKVWCFFVGCRRIVVPGVCRVYVIYWSVCPTDVLHHAW